ncbi:heparin lyase I family protein [Streptomyces formicae]|uniref:Heparin lyase I family protein n=1 Tax=Streptomyces formicae TaxID=1616117 RepID=A0ABY3WNI2_9ACTN|nr:heparin lyase I family protein [Streptomyces formicae]UNM12140.1 heparin lyase I family protein [Streptomyces formicae]
MRRRTVRTILGGSGAQRSTGRAPSRLARKRFHALPVAAAAMTLLNASSANAAVIWNGDASNGSGAFGTFLCDAPSYITTPDWGDGRGKIWAVTKKAGSDRCELHNVRLNGTEYAYSPGRAYWFGWESMTSTDNAATVFQWKSQGPTHQQNYPILMAVSESRLKVWYVAPGQVWHDVGSIPWKPQTWHRIELGINVQSGTNGGFEVWLDGQRFVNAGNARTWDDTGNKPRWGTYGSSILNQDSVNWINDLKMGDTRGDVD